MQSESVENIFARAWSLLTKNPVIIAPGFVVGIVVGVIQTILTPHPRFVDTAGNTDTLAVAAGVGSAVSSAAILTVVGILAFLITETYTTGMAGAAWRS